jgi:tetratricopeptide (TPR) repeat protein
VLSGDSYRSAGTLRFPFGIALDDGANTISRSQSNRWRTKIFFSLSLIGLLVLTVWNLTRSVALARAAQAYARSELASCLGHALDHLERQPWSHEGALWAARCLSRLDYSEQAEPYFLRAGQLTQTDQQLRAYGLARGPHPLLAIPAYNEILARWPDNLTALRRLAAVQLAQNDARELLELAERISGAAGGAVIGHTLRGVTYHNGQNPQQAVIAFENVLKLDPDLREMPLTRHLFWSYLTDDLIESGRVEDAARYLTRAVAENPDAELMTQLGQIYFLQGSVDDAERCFLEAVEWAPSDFRPQLSLAKLALQRSDREKALKHLNMANVLEPQHHEVLYSLASVYRQLGLTAEADSVQETIKHLRDALASPSATASMKSPWPRYAL